MHFVRVTLVLALLVSLATLAGCALPGFQPSKPAKPHPSEEQCVVLVLEPGGIANKIVSGAMLAANELRSSNRSNLKVRVIYTRGNWLKEVQSLPEQYAVVGGPLKRSSYQQMRSAGILDKRAVFTFLGRLDSGEEGTRAWRFATSPQDQIDAIVKFAVDTMDMRNIGSYTPNDAYSRNMTALLEQSLAEENVILQRHTYAGVPTKEGVASIVNPKVDELTGIITPNTPFEAVVLTDSWRRIDAIKNAFASNGEERLLMLGTLWDSSLSARPTANADKYSLMVFPGAFVRERAPQALKRGYDYWGALGYDFVRFAVRMNLSKRLPAAQVTSRARQAALMEFAIAPISYNSQGKARQKLFMMQAGPQGASLVNTSQVRAARAAAIQRMEERANAPAELQPAIMPVEPTPAPAPRVTPAPVQQAAPRAAAPSGSNLMPEKPVYKPQINTPNKSGQTILRETPNPSYKLSLPGAR